MYKLENTKFITSLKFTYNVKNTYIYRMNNNISLEYE